MNKAHERGMVEGCVAFLGYPLACILQLERERPDALARIDGVVTGLEVTTVIEAKPRQPTPPQKWTAETKRLVAKAREVFESAHQIPLIVRLQFRADWRPGAAKSGALAEDLASAVAKATATPWLFARPGDPITVRNPHPAVERLYVAPATYSGEGHWEPSFVGQVLAASEADIRETVRRKEQELPAYRPTADAVWLLIDCNLSGQGRMLEAPEPFGIRTGFDRVFCSDFGMWRWVELPRVL